MPKENKKRGRRAEAQKRKLEDGEEDQEQHDDQLQKRQKVLDTPPQDLETSQGIDYELQDAYAPGVEGGNDVTFYGLLDEEDAEYFRRADNMLEANQFSDPEERNLFLANVHKEANGKELKMACSQSCSRLFERLILLSTPAQLKNIFQKFSGHFLNLVQHRFASHCCEALFLQSAPIVTRELLAGPATKSPSLAHESEEVFVSMENLFLYAINEFSGNLGFLLTDRFASHTLRVLLLVLSGQPLDDPTQTTLVKSRKKETIDVVDLDRKPDEASHASLRVVPESFTTSLDSLIKESIGDLDSSYLRALATHPIGNPALQSLLRLDLTHFGKTRAKDTTSIIQKLLPLEALSEGSEGATFINGLMYDPIGSRLLETIVEFCPGKIFKALYRQFFRERIGSLARNEISAYVIIKLLGRLSADDLRDALAGILPQFPSLIERGRTAVIRTLAERCVARGVEAKPLAAALTDSCTEDGGKSFSLLILLRIPTHPANTTNAATPPSSEPSNSPPVPTPTASTTTPSTNPSHAPTNPSITLHASLLAQSLVLLPSQPLHTLIFDSLTYLEPPLYHTLATHASTSHLLQTALTSPHATLIFRRKLISRFYGRIADLATHPAGSHLVDAIWTATVGLGFMRERIAEELAENEAALRESSVGRKVWRNWRMDVYKRRPNEWMREMRREAGNDGFLPFPLDGDCERKEAGREPRTRSRGGANGGTPPGAAGGKTGLQLARERFAKSHNLRKEAKSVEG